MQNLQSSRGKLPARCNAKQRTENWKLKTLAGLCLFYLSIIV